MGKFVKGNSAFKGKKHTEESKIKIGNAHKGQKSFLGRKHSKKTKELMSQKSKTNPNVFKQGNIPWNKGKKFPNKSGKNNSCWKGGRYKHSAGYIMKYNPKHPYAYVGYVLEHRLVMEKHLGRYLTKDEVVHHINGNREDNVLENLELFSNNSVHLISHRKIERINKRS